MIISLIWALIFFIAAALMSGNLTLFSLGMGCLSMYFILKELPCWNLTTGENNE